MPGGDPEAYMPTGRNWALGLSIIVCSLELWLS